MKWIGMFAFLATLVFLCLSYHNAKREATGRVGYHKDGISLVRWDKDARVVYQYDLLGNTLSEKDGKIWCVTRYITPVRTFIHVRKEAQVEQVALFRQLIG